MKKSVMAAVFAVIALAAFADEEKKWTNALGVSVEVPLARFDTDEFGTVNQISAGLRGSYLGCAGNGFTVKGTLSTGGAFSGDVPLGDDTGFKGGMQTDMTLGAGWSPIRTEKWLVSATGLIALTFSRYTQDGKYAEDSELGDVERVSSAALLSLALGAEVQAAYRLRGSMSLCAGIQFRWIPGGITLASSLTAKGDSARLDLHADEIGSSFQITPSAGLMWRF